MEIETKDFFTESLSSFFSNLYTVKNILISNKIWTELMFRQVYLNNQVDCSALCYFEVGSKCKIYAFQPPICYLGDPMLNNTASSNMKNVTLFSNYGKCDLVDNNLK